MHHMRCYSTFTATRVTFEFVHELTYFRIFQAAMYNLCLVWGLEGKRFKIFSVPESEEIGHVAPRRHIRQRRPFLRQSVLKFPLLFSQIKSKEQ